MLKRETDRYAARLQPTMEEHMKAIATSLVQLALAAAQARGESAGGEPRFPYSSELCFRCRRNDVDRTRAAPARRRATPTRANAKRVDRLKAQIPLADTL